MDETIFELIDEAAEHLTTDMMLVVNSLEGVYTRVFREDPSVRGLNRFMAETAEVPDAAHRLAREHLERFQERTAVTRTALDPESPGNPETLSLALQQLRTQSEALRLFTARRFRSALVSRLSIAPPLTGGLRLMNRAGHQLQARDMFYLIGRKAAIDIFNEAQIAGLASEGQRTAMVFHRDPRHATHGALISIDARLTGLPHYQEVQDKWFHPRSSAVIGRSE